MQGFGLAVVGRDVEVRYLPDGSAVANVSLAFSYGRKGEDGRRPTQWVDAALWGKRAEALAPYLLKGTKVAVTLDDVHEEAFKRRDGTPGTKLVGSISHLALAGGPKEAPKAAPSDDDEMPF